MSEFDDARTGTGTKEWAEHNVNVCRGCSHNCLYCYAAANAARFGQRKRSDWGREELTKGASIASYAKRNGVVMFPTAHDITPVTVDAYIRVAKLILVSGNRLLIVTKGNRRCMNEVMRELLPWREQVHVRITIGAINKQLADLWEPGAPEPMERLDAFADAELWEYGRSISIEPMLAGVEETIKVIRNAIPWGPETIWIGKMNQISRRVIKDRPEVVAAIKVIQEQQSDAEIMRLVREVGHLPCIRWKDSVKEVMSRKGCTM